jgi:hypothetical protein
MYQDIIPKHKEEATDDIREKGAAARRAASLFWVLILAGDSSITKCCLSFCIDDYYKWS